MHNPDEPPQNPILHLIEFGHAVLDFKIAMTAEPKDWRDHCRNLQDAWAKTSNVDIQRLPVDALYRIRSLRENQNKTHKHDGRGAPSAYDLAIILWVDFRLQSARFTFWFQRELEDAPRIADTDFIFSFLALRYDVAELMKIGLLIDAEFKYAERCYLIDTLPPIQREIFKELSEAGEATRAELAAALQDKVETGEIQRPIATSDKPIRDAVKNLLDIKLIRELPNSKGILQINS